MIQGRIIISFMLFLGVLAPNFAVERSLIDFSTYNENIGQVVDKDQQLYDEKVAENPDLDLRNFGWPDFSFEADDWNLENWKIVLNPSAVTVENTKNSLIKNSPSETYGNVLGVRLHFQAWRNAFWGFIKTPFYLPATYINGQFISQNDQDQDAGLAVGLLANVGQIKNVRSWAYGLNYDYKYGVQTVNETGKLVEYGMGSLYYEGWRRLSWDNPKYTADPNDWTPTKNPLYPYSYPYVKFESLAFYKNSDAEDSNFIGYVKDVTMDYDLAIVLEENDINNEAIWQLLGQEAIRHKIVTSKILAEQLIARRKVEKLQDANQENEEAADEEAAQ